MPEGITPAQARRFYDRFGRAQDLQFYEDRAFDRLLSLGAFDRAESVFELGCGTGRFAARLLPQLPAGARYVGQDVSETMVRICRERFGKTEPRAELRCGGELWLPDDDASFDRFVATYVLDLMPPDTINEVLNEAGRVVRPDGLLCVVALTHGEGRLSRWLSRAWERIATLRPEWVGGCRPIEVAPRLGGAWRIEHRELVTVMAITSEVVVARRVGPST